MGDNSTAKRKKKKKKEENKMKGRFDHINESLYWHVQFRLEDVD
ncbi:hypothetical protein QG37_06592 [Candidozyma auris]|uniref:Uncharacterized protein n=1 Tax=Candidozyma auris TaxID=498019 RepID=A0A0L0NSS3_CANAR|nr:hypothetical protein QG37_06592 [[Candida] auris]